MMTFLPLRSKLIYVFRINDKAHEGRLKIGEATCEVDDLKATKPCSKLLNDAAKRRINQYTQTAGIAYELLYTELAIYECEGRKCSFRDTDVHDVLLRSGVEKEFFNKQHKANEWFITDLETVKKAIEAVKKGRHSLRPGDISQNLTPIQFRPEQQEAIDKTKLKFKDGNKMLWNAKMRFGKTLSALQVVKDMDFKRTLILTHRPVVNNSWFEDFNKIFSSCQDFAYGSKNKGESHDILEKKANSEGLKYVYFASMQDLRGSEIVGGDFDKNDEIFSTPWSLIIVDEAHEGIQTELGMAVIKELEKDTTKILRLSGTPFNLIQDFQKDEIYTWDYVMEQRSKRDWDNIHFGDPNPYATLPTLNILTFNLGHIWQQFVDESIAFNFREFFRVNEDGSFVHQSDVLSFLNLLTKEDKNSNYPFANESYRNIFRHSLWIVPGVKEAKALSALLRIHPVFQYFNVINVAGDGDEDELNKDALEVVEEAIGSDPETSYTITVSCGRLTTGVSVPAWTAVLMLSGSYNTSASSYMQTIFRVQTPATINGKVKEECYVFDFAPDRTLKVLAEAARISSIAGKTTKNDRQIMGDFLNFCPVISINGSRMDKLNVSAMLEELKKVYVERVVRNGFEDNYLYNDELLKLSDAELNAFKELKKIIGHTKSMPKTNEIDINRQGLTDEQYEEKEKLEKKNRKKALTEEEKECLERLREQTRNRENAISILRGISIRMPLLIYGAELKNEKDDLTLDNFTNLVDDKSWQEFMPNGVTKEKFNLFKKFYDPEVFCAAGKRIRDLVRAADKLPMEERIERITDIFSTFRNPDKETVLTPWRVVNLHLADTIGGYSFFDDKYKERTEIPHFVDQGAVTEKVFDSKSKVLEINSKSGLYPLYVTYSIYRSKLKELGKSDLTIEEQNAIWDQIVAENIFVICKTPMAKEITKRTLVGFREVRVNSKYFDGLINQVKNKPEKFISKVFSYFGVCSGDNTMKFNAVVGNPPYQEVVAKKETINGQKRSSSIFQHFQRISEKLGNYTSLIYPGKRWIHQSGKGLKDFGSSQINDPHLSLLMFYPDSTEIFKDVGIADGISIVLKDMSKCKLGFKYVFSEKGEKIIEDASCPGKELFSLNPRDYQIVKQLNAAISKYGCLADSVLSQKLFSIESDFVEKNAKLVREYNEGDKFDCKTEIKLFANDKAGKSGRSRWYITKREVIRTGIDYLDRWKVIVSSANAGGQKRDSQIEIVDNFTAFGRQRVALKTFATQKEAENFLKYAKSEVIRYAFLLTDESLTSLAKKVPDIQNYSDEYDLIDYEKDVNLQLYNLFGISKKDQEYIRNKLSLKNK